MTQIFLDCETVGAEIYVDGEMVGEAPCTVQVKYGEHTFSAKKNGLREYVDATVYKEGQREWKLPIIYTEITIKCALAGAEIYVDGEYVGVPPCKVPVTFEEHNVRAELDGLYSTMVIEVERNGKREWTAPAPNCRPTPKTSSPQRGNR